MSIVASPTPRTAASARVPWPRRVGWAWFALTASAIAVFAPLPYLTTSLSGLAEAGDALAAHYAATPTFVRIALVVHATFGGVALFLVPLQLLRPFRQRFVRAHRAVGRILVGAIVVAGSAALVVAQDSSAGMLSRIGFSMLGILWVTSAVMAARTAIRGDLAAHRPWAIRVAALTYAAVTLRLWLGVLIAAQTPSGQAEVDAAFDRAYQVVVFLSWVPNLLVAEWVVRRGRGRGPRIRSPRPAGATPAAR